MLGDACAQSGAKRATRCVDPQSLTVDREAHIETAKLLEQSGGVYNSISSRSSAPDLFSQF
jgi:hypothetical protein